MPYTIRVTAASIGLGILIGSYKKHRPSISFPTGRLNPHKYQPRIFRRLTQSMTDGGGSVILKSGGGHWCGSGHCAVFQILDQEYPIFDTYSSPDRSAGDEGFNPQIESPLTCNRKVAANQKGYSVCGIAS